MMKKSDHIRQLIRTIYLKGWYDSEGVSAMKALVQHGRPGLDAMVEIEKRPPDSPMHGRDLAETISGVYWMFAEKFSSALIEHLRNGTLDSSHVYSALGNAKDKTSIDVLIEGLNDRTMWARWMAVDSLIGRKSKRAVGPLLRRLRDRSSDIKSSVIFAMMRNKWLRRSQSLPELKRLRNSPSMQKYSPGTWQRLAELIALIEREQRDK